MRKLARLVAAVAATFCGVGAANAALLYQYSFDGATGTGAPAVTAGGGTLTFTKSANGSGSLNGPGVSGGANDKAYDGYGGGLNGLGSNQYNTGDPASIASTATADVASGLGTLNQLTMTMWIKPSRDAGFPMAAQNNSAINARLAMVGPSSIYDQGAGGFHVSLNNSDTIQRGVNGINPTTTTTISSTLTTANGGTPYNDWVFVAFAYDGSTAANEVFFNTAIRAATNNTDNNNSYVYLGRKTGSVVLYDTTALQTGNVSPGALTFNGTNGFVQVGNRQSNLTRDFTGLIDDVRIYNNVLSTTQLEAVRDSALVPEPASFAMLAMGGIALIRRKR